VNDIAICFKASLSRGRAMADAVARGMSSPYYRDQNLRRPPRRLSFARTSLSISGAQEPDHFLERLVRPSVEEINIEATLVFNSGRIEMGTILNFPTTLSL
jgi:hypothetical protein